MIKLLFGDCLKIIPAIKPNSIDCIICDLPYGILDKKLAEWDNIIPFEKLWENYDRLLKYNGIVILFGTELFTSKIILSNIKDFKERLIWKKHKPSNFACGKYRHLKYTEDICVFAKSSHYTFHPQKEIRISPRIQEAQNYDKLHKGISKKSINFATLYPERSWLVYDANEKIHSDIIEIPAISPNSKERTSCPVQKPVKLIQYLLKVYTDVKDVVMDNCMGSGTTGVACMEMNRNFIGIENNKEYFEIAKKRLNYNE